MIVRRRETSLLADNSSWTLLFGRRKTGKTYLLRNLIDIDRYYYVRKDGSISSDSGRDDILPKDLVDIIAPHLRKGKIIVVDEFQRLPDHFFDDISLLHPHGKLILTGSSMKIVNSMMSSRSPLLGMLFPVQLSLIDPVDILRSLSGVLSSEEAIELAPFLQDPWTIPLLEGKWDMRPFIETLHYIVPGLIGEVFTMEDKDLTRTYDAIISLIGSGVGDVSEIANILYTRGITSNPGSNYIFPYVKNMQKMGLIRQDGSWKGRKNRYSLISSAMELYHHLNSRYDLDSRYVSYEEVRPTVEKFKNIAIERFLGDLFARVYNGRVMLLKTHDMEIDIMITRRNRPYLIAEVKWGKVKKKDLMDFEMKTGSFNCRKVLVSKKRVDHDVIESLTPDDIMSLIDDHKDREANVFHSNE